MSPILRRAFCLALLLLVPCTPAMAGTFSETVTGTLVPGGPVLPQTGIISTPNCTGAYVAFAVLYAVQPLIVAETGSYHFDEPGAESAVYILHDAFDPANVADNCTAASNTNPISLDVALTSGVQYYVVVIEDTFAQDGMDYTLTVSGPGAITLGIPSAIEVPTLSDWSLGLLALVLASLAVFAMRRRVPAPE